MGRDIKVWRYAFRQLFAQAMTRWTIFLLFSSFVSFDYILPLPLSFSLVRHIFDERRRKLFECSTRRREVCERRKKRTHERTNQHRFVYTVAIADEPSYIYFSFPNDQIGRRWTSNIVSLFIYPSISFPSHHSQFHTNESGNRTTRVFLLKQKTKKRNWKSIFTAWQQHIKVKKEKDMPAIFWSLLVTNKSKTITR